MHELRDPVAFERQGCLTSATRPPRGGGQVAWLEREAPSLASRTPRGVRERCPLGDPFLKGEKLAEGKEGREARARRGGGR